MGCAEMKAQGSDSHIVSSYSGISWCLLVERQVGMRDDTQDETLNHH